MNDYIKLGSLFLILMGVGVLFRKYEDKLNLETKTRNDDAIREYLLTDPDTLDNIVNHKPILWIPIHYDYNSRNWQSFGSRSSYDLNQPYIYLTVKSIIKYCKDSFHIALIDEKSFERLLPKWKYKNSFLANPVAEHVRHLAMATILYNYGGICVPPSFLCMKDMIDLYNNAVSGNTMFVVENINRTVNYNSQDYIGDIRFMGANPRNAKMGELVKYMEILTETDKTAQSDFLGSTNKWCNMQIDDGHINKVDAKLIGVRENNGDMIMVEELISNNYLDLSTHAYGIYIPANDILSRNKYSWFARLSGKQLLESNTIIGKYLLLSNIPGKSSERVIKEDKSSEPEWISYWQVPSNAPVWGVKPNYLGNNIVSGSSREL